MSPADALGVVADAVDACTLPSWTGAAPGKDLRTARLARSFRELGFDSLAYMEFCISIHAATGVEIGIAEVERLGTPEAVATRLAGAA